MRQVDGEKEYALTRGDLRGKPYTYGNLSPKGKAEHAEVSRSHSTKVRDA
ncbi:hypothetical protein MK805_03060 [Shimazuella sp. AN120528]|nr:hypothetical protein [Shimazuella soli]MCH5583942.1 hypothetical protein [Shimazuella soli]